MLLSVPYTIPKRFCPRRRTLLKGYSPSLLFDTIWKAGFFSLSPLYFLGQAHKLNLSINK